MADANRLVHASRQERRVDVKEQTAVNASPGLAREGVRYLGVLMSLRDAWAAGLACVLYMDGLAAARAR
jgi:hypothetical protein